MTFSLCLLTNCVLTQKLFCCNKNIIDVLKLFYYASSDTNCILFNHCVQCELLLDYEMPILSILPYVTVESAKIYFLPNVQMFYIEDMLVLSIEL